MRFGACYDEPMNRQTPRISTWQFAILVGVAGAIACGSSRAPFVGNGDVDAGPGPGETFPEAGVASSPCERAAEEPSFAGCRFLATDSRLTGWNSPSSGTEDANSGTLCLALVVTNPSEAPVHLRLRVEDREEDAAPYTRVPHVTGRDVVYEPLVDDALQPGQTAVVSAQYFYDDDGPFEHARCPVDAFVTDGRAAAQNDTITPAIELSADAPVLVVQITRFQKDARPAPPDLSLTPGTTNVNPVTPLVPVEAWETSPIDTGLFKTGMPHEVYMPAREEPEESDALFFTGKVRTIIGAAFDDTIVHVPRLDGGAPRAVTIPRNHVYSYTANDTFIGSPVVANQPINLLTYDSHALWPWDGYAIGFRWEPTSLALSSVPTRFWGPEHVAVRHGNRWPDWPEAPSWRILAANDDTRLTYEPYRPEGAPDRLGKGELALFFADEPFVVRAQDAAHPVYLGVHMNGGVYQQQRFGVDAPYEEVRGNPLSTFSVATAQWRNAYRFFALPRATQNNLVVVRHKGGSDVRLDCAGTLQGWQPVGDTFEYVRVPLTGPRFEPVVYPDGECHAGSHLIESREPFTATLWAWGELTDPPLDVGTNLTYVLPLVGSNRPTTDGAH